MDFKLIDGGFHPPPRLQGGEDLRPSRGGRYRTNYGSGEPLVYVGHLLVFAVGAPREMEASLMALVVEARQGTYRLVGAAQDAAGFVSFRMDSAGKGQKTG